MRKGMVETLDFLIAPRQVAIGLLEFGLALMARQFRLFARRDVHHDSANLLRLVRLGKEGDDVTKPDCPAIRGKHAVLEVEILFFVSERGEQLDYILAVLWMNVLLPKIALFEPSGLLIAKQPDRFRADKSELQRWKVGLPDNAIDGINQVA